MTKIQTEPIFEVTKRITIDVNDVDGTMLHFDADPVGPQDHFRLRILTNYSERYSGVVMPTIGELVPLISASFIKTGEIEEVEGIVQALLKNPIMGRTMVVMGEDGILVDDNPPLELLDDVIAYERSLRSRLDSEEKDGVIYSRDGVVRFVSNRKFHLGPEPSLKFAENKGLIAIVGNKSRAEMLAKRGIEFYACQSRLGDSFNSC